MAFPAWPCPMAIARAGIAGFVGIADRVETGVGVIKFDVRWQPSTRRCVIGTTTTSPEEPSFIASAEMTTAGRRPDRSRPTGSPKSTSQSSPRRTITGANQGAGRIRDLRSASICVRASGSPRSCRYRSLNATKKFCRSPRSPGLQPFAGPRPGGAGALRKRLSESLYE